MSDQRCVWWRRWDGGDECGLLFGSLSMEATSIIDVMTAEGGSRGRKGDVRARIAISWIERGISIIGIASASVVLF